MFEHRKRQIAREMAANGYVEDESFNFNFAGNANGIYIDVNADGECDDNTPANWTLTVKIKTMAPSEAMGVQVTKLELDNFKQQNPVLPLP